MINFDPPLRGYFEWPSTNWAEHFAKERELQNLIFLFSVVFNILVEHTLVAFELERMASTQLAG